uniref:Uncharacterized protein n=1 Tax=Rhizophora mucronata TaxID=61149 RepID=A0A2P2J5D8_RHIMU
MCINGVIKIIYNVPLILCVTWEVQFFH